MEMSLAVLLDPISENFGRFFCKKKFREIFLFAEHAFRVAHAEGDCFLTRASLP
jgi:hypothetical protein